MTRSVARSPSVGTATAGFPVATATAGAADTVEEAVLEVATEAPAGA